MGRLVAAAFHVRKIVSSNPSNWIIVILVKREGWTAFCRSCTLSISVFAALSSAEVASAWNFCFKLLSFTLLECSNFFEGKWLFLLQSVYWERERWLALEDEGIRSNVGLFVMVFHQMGKTSSTEEHSPHEITLASSHGRLECTTCRKDVKCTGLYNHSDTHSIVTGIISTWP